MFERIIKPAALHATEFSLQPNAAEAPLAEPIYLMRLAGDLYLDNDGVLHKGAIPSSPSYTLPGGFLLSADEASR